MIGSVIDGNSAGGALGGGVFNVSLIRRQHDLRQPGQHRRRGRGVPGPEHDDHHVDPGRQPRHVLRRRDRRERYVTVTRSTLAGNMAGGRLPRRRRRGRARGRRRSGCPTARWPVTARSPRAVVRSTTTAGWPTLSFDTLSGNSGCMTGSSYSTATGTILATDGPERTAHVPLHETAGYNLADDRSCGRPARPTWPGPTRSSGRWRPWADRLRPRRCCPAARPSTPAASPATSGCPLT